MAARNFELYWSIQARNYAGEKAKQKGSLRIFSPLWSQCFSPNWVLSRGQKFTHICSRGDWKDEGTPCWTQGREINPSLREPQRSSCACLCFSLGYHVYLKPTCNLLLTAHQLSFSSCSLVTAAYSLAVGLSGPDPAGLFSQDNHHQLTVASGSLSSKFEVWIWIWLVPGQPVEQQH